MVLFGFLDLVWFQCQGSAGLVNRVWKRSLLFFFFLKGLRRVGVQPSLKVCQGASIKSPAPRLFCIGTFLSNRSTSFLAIGLLGFSVSSRFGLSGLCASRNLSVSSKSSCPLARSARSSLFDYWHFCAVSWNVSSFISDFIQVVSLFF